jgi:hypothetical protein
MSQYRSTSTSSTTDGGIVTLAVGVAVLAAPVWAMVWCARLLAHAVAIAFSPASVFSVAGLATLIVQNVVLGLFAGLAVGLVAAWRRRDGKTQPSFVSVLFDEAVEHLNFGAEFWGKVIMFALIGAAIAAVAGLIGALAGPIWSPTAAHAVLTNPHTPIVALLSGGASGAGGPDVLSLIFLGLVLLIMALVVGSMTGVLLHLAIFGLGGMAKGAVEEYVASLVSGRNRSSEEPSTKKKPIVMGLRRGLSVGLALGAMEIAFTTLEATSPANRISRESSQPASDDAQSSQASNDTQLSQPASDDTQSSQPASDDAQSSQESDDTQSPHAGPTDAR